MNILLAYMKCSTCQKAKKHLEELKIDFKIKDIVNEKLSEDELKSIIKDKDIDKFFNKKGLVYKELNLKDKIDNLSFEEKLSLLASNGKLVKRPILIFKDKVLIGYVKKEYEELING